MRPPVALLIVLVAVLGLGQAAADMSNTTPSTCPLPEPPFAASHNTCSPCITFPSLPRPFPAPLGRHLQLARPRLVVLRHCQDKRMSRSNSKRNTSRTDQKEKQRRETQKEKSSRYNITLSALLGLSQNFLFSLASCFWAGSSLVMR